MEQTDAGRLAHLLRRATLGPAPGRLEDLADLGPDGALDALIGSSSADAGADPSAEPIFDEPVLEVPDRLRSGDTEPFLRWWIERMAEPRQGLHERMVWFWHSHFTTNRNEVATVHLVNQHELVRHNALGNLRDLVTGMVVDGAMLIYLDGDGSVGSSPNENLARELMELFTLGRGHYTEDDVRAAARALSGWWVDWETGDVGFDPEAGYPGTLQLLGERGRYGARDVAEMLCDHPACAPHVAGRLFEHLVGSPPSDEVRAELGQSFADANLEILPLVEAILRHPDFAASVMARPRFPLEWFLAAGNALQVPLGDVDDHLWMLDLLGQGPFLPPNVGGWPGGDRLISPSQVLAKIGTTFWLTGDPEPAPPPFPEDDPVPAALMWCGVPDVSDETRRILDDAYWAPLDAAAVNQLLVHLIVQSPEFALS
ncbi:MAG: DUF1800 domain-containing protein [Acidimicrobiales bacterium]|nr:DUF1800 domain-containing protein [Acidimicrobiales bacterium]